MKEENIIEELKRKVEEGDRLPGKRRWPCHGWKIRRLCTRRPGLFGIVLPGGILILARS